MTEKKKVVILGATGLIGKSLTQLFLDHGDWKVSCLVRRAPTLNHPYLELEVVNFQEHAHLGKYLQCDLLVSCLGTTMKVAGSKEAFEFVDATLPLSLARQAHEQGCEAMMTVSSIGASPKSGSYYTRVKGQVEEDLKKVGFKSLHIMRPSLLLGQRNEKRAGEDIGKVLGGLISPLLMGPMRRYRPIEAHDVAKAMLHLAQNNEDGVFIHESEALQRISML